MMTTLLLLFSLLLVLSHIMLPLLFLIVMMHGVCLPMPLTKALEVLYVYTGTIPGHPVPSTPDSCCQERRIMPSLT